jgi:hypothetical protein
VVFIVIAVQNGLEEIKKGLKNRGYTVVDIEGYNYPIDAMIYEGNSFQVSYVSGNNMPEMSTGERNNYGVLIINSKGKSLDAIEEMLKMRCYEHLF